MESVPVADLYRIVNGEVRLMAGRRQHDGALVFPFPTGAEAALHDLVLLPASGTLWSWTIQSFAPKSPYDGPAGADFRPYGVVYVQLGDMLIVEGRVAQTPPPPLSIGQPMRVITVDYACDEQGRPWQTYAFTPMDAVP